MPFQLDYRALVRTDPQRYTKATLFESTRLLLGLNCLAAGQSQPTHAHEGQDKFYFVLEGEGDFQVADERSRVGPGAAIWAPAGSVHSVSNPGPARLVLLVGIAPSSAP
jgi:mannose-6-phosphate isomerase-like protein (cupin superfamily)